MVWIEKDLSAIAKAVLDNWETKKPELQYQHLFASSGRVTYGDLVRLIEKGEQANSLKNSRWLNAFNKVSGKPTTYVLQETTGIPERDKMFKMYTSFKQNYPGFHAPDPKVLALGVQPAGPEDFVRERILPALGM